MNHSPPPPGFASPDTFAQARQLLVDRQFTDTGVLAALDAADMLSITQRDLPLMLFRTRQLRPLDVLIRLFLINLPVDPQPLADALDPMSVDEWLEAGLLRRDDDGFRSTVKLLPFRGLYLAYDHLGVDRTDLAADHVMGIGRSTLTLANLVMPLADAQSLDLGTGCGTLAFLMSNFSRRVTGVDFNQRAVALSEFNARLNGLGNVEFRAGDMLQPVAGEQFDLVVSNPPFVISPRSQFIYRDSGMEGDGITQKIVREVPEYLREGGFCLILTNWAHMAGTPTAERLQSWFAGTGCDVWALAYETLDTATYASTWIQHSEGTNPQRYAESFDEWLRYYDEQRIEAITGGVIVMRKSGRSSGWFLQSEMPRQAGPCGPALKEAFERHDFLAAHPDEAAVLGTCFRLSPEVRLQQTCRPQQGGWGVEQVELRIDRGLTATGRIDAFTADLLVTCDGTRTLGELVPEMAARLQTPPPGLAGDVARVARQLVSQGFLLPSPSTGTDGAPDPAETPSAE